MSENIANRVSRLISGSINALIDAAENISPIVVMQESIREVDSAISEIRHELGQVIVSQHLIQERIDSEQNKFQDLNQQIKVALSENREDLAEAAISKQIDIEAQLPVLKRSLNDDSKKIEELESYISALQAKQREMNEELKRFKEVSSVASTSTNPTSSASQKVSKAESAFNRVIGINVTSTQHQDSAKLVELEELTRKNRIQERLNAMKAAQ
jgi:phage shock protein A